MQTGLQGFNAYVASVRETHGDNFSDVALAPKFREYFGHRIEVRTRHGETIRGWLSGTNGWTPSFMLLKRRDSSGSSQLIGDADEFVRLIKRGPR